jgi:hypothetical protein
MRSANSEGEIPNVRVGARDNFLQPVPEVAQHTEEEKVSSVGSFVPSFDDDDFEFNIDANAAMDDGGPSQF